MFGDGSAATFESSFSPSRGVAGRGLKSRIIKKYINTAVCAACTRGIFFCFFISYRKRATIYLNFVKTKLIPFTKPALTFN